MVKLAKTCSRVVLFSLIAYFAAVLVLGLIPRNASFRPYSGNDGVEIFVRSNGVHTDLVFPIQHPLFDWRTQPLWAAFQPDPSHTHISVGWGSRELYLNTPTWADLTPQIAFVSLSGLGQSLMHVELLPTPAPDANTVRLSLSPSQYRQLVAYALGAFASPTSHAIRGYTPTDVFFPAKGWYHLFNPCNEWTRRGLTHIGVRTPIWSPFDPFLFWHLR
ncbi:MAG: TIGR02117 family protein [Anaerolineae bacterium]|nr:TIGR02117 family protein [Anaerolineae bacterium]